MRLLYVVMAASYSIVFCFAIAVVRIRRIHPSFHPFIWLTVCAMLHELVSFLLISIFKESNAVSYSVFSLIEGLLWVWQFSKWPPYTGQRSFSRSLAILFAALWLADNLVFGTINSFSSTYGLVYSFILVFVAINRINEIIVREPGSLYKNSKFLICLGVVVFYTYRIMIESFYIIKLQESASFLSNVFAILACVNLFVNLLFAIAIIWIPSRLKFSLPY